MIYVTDIPNPLSNTYIRTLVEELKRQSINAQFSPMYTIPQIATAEDRVIILSLLGMSDYLLDHMRIIRNLNNICTVTIMTDLDHNLPWTQEEGIAEYRLNRTQLYRGRDPWANQLDEYLNDIQGGTEGRFKKS